MNNPQCHVVIGRAGSGKSVFMEKLVRYFVDGDHSGLALLYVQHKNMPTRSKFVQSLLIIPEVIPEGAEESRLLEFTDAADILSAALIDDQDGDSAVMHLGRRKISRYGVVVINNVESFGDQRICKVISTLCHAGATVFAAGVDVDDNGNLNEATHRVVSLATHVYITRQAVPVLPEVILAT